jgi:hypothetical protein
MSCGVVSHSAAVARGILPTATLVHPCTSSLRPKVALKDIVSAHHWDHKTTRTIFVKHTYKATLALLLLITIIPAFADKARTENVQDCDRKVLEKTERNLSHLKSNDVERFLMTFDSNCTHHDNFHDWGNILLFQVLQRKPKFFIQHLETIPNGKRRAILTELESPLHSGIDVKAIIRKVEKVKEHDRARDDVLYSLRQAEQKF